MDNLGREAWAVRLEQARLRMFPTTWRAARALHDLDPVHLPDVKTLHRYWSERWETGLIRPNRTYRELIEKLLQAPGLFREPGRPVWSADSAESVHHVDPADSAAADSSVDSVGPVERADVGSVNHGDSVHPYRSTQRTHRPNVGNRGNSTGLGRVIRMAADDAAEDAAVSDAGLGDRTLEQLHADIRRTAREYPSRPLPEVFLAARQTREFAMRLAQRTRRPDQLADLHAIAGQACGLLAVAAYDMGYWDSAARFADTTLTHADLAGNTSLRAWALGKRAFMANWLGHTDDALDWTSMALGFAPPGTATVRLRSIQARAHALRGDRDNAEQAVRAAEDALTVDSHDELHDDIGGEFHYTAARMEVSTATSYVLLNDGLAAGHHAQRAIDLHMAMPSEVRPYYDEHAARVDLATARVLRGDLAGARDALGPVFALPPARRTAGVTSRLDRLRGMLGAEIFRNSREAAQLASDIADFTADTAARALPPDQI